MPLIKAGSININYQLYGEGEPLLLIMGFGAPGAAWLLTLPMLTGFKCIYFDNRGTGMSDKPAIPYTAEDMADDASNLLRAIGIPRAKVYGMSMGGMIAQELAIRHPDQVIKVVLGCTMAGGSTAKLAPPEAGLKLVTAIKLMSTDPDKAFDMIMPLVVPPKFIAAHPEFKQMMLAGRTAIPPTPPETAERAMAGLATFNAYDRLPQIKCPVLIVHGDQDALIPAENAAIIKTRIPHAELYTIPGAGHMYSAEDPVGVNKRIVDWLKR